jgi:spore germination cell wall hydrolase CwlJ-like protein
MSASPVVGKERYGMIKLHAGDVELLGRVIWAEARSQSFEGQCAVAWVILNRLNREEGRFPKTLQGVIQQPYAFSCFNTNDPQCAKVKTVSETDPAFVEALHAATAVLTGRVASPIADADHYYLTSMAKPPAWAKKMTLIKKIGGHSFFRELPAK